MNMTKREKILIIFVLMLAVVCIYYFYFLQPCLNEIKDLSSKKTSSELTLKTNIQLQQKNEEVVQKITDEEEQIAKFLNNETAAFDQPMVLVYLYETINKYGHKVTISFNESGDLGQLKVCNVSITMEGTYGALKSILKELAEGEYFIKVIELSVSKNANASKGTTDSSQTAEPSTEPVNNTVQKDILSISLSLEFYNLSNEIPPDKTYPFTSGAVQYGGDIFN